MSPLPPRYLGLSIFLRGYIRAGVSDAMLLSPRALGKFVFNAWTTVVNSCHRIFLSSFDLATSVTHGLLRELETLCSIDGLGLRLPGFQVTTLTTLTNKLIETANSRPRPDRLLGCFEILVVLNVAIIDSSLRGMLVTARESSLYAKSKFMGMLVQAYVQTVHPCMF